MLAVLRYRHIPYRLIVGSHRSALDLPKPKVALLPTFYLPTNRVRLRRWSIPRLSSAAWSATFPLAPSWRPIRRSLSSTTYSRITGRVAHQGDVPLSLALCRRHRARREILPRWSVKPVPEEKLASMKQMIGDRQISRLRVVGSNATTAPIIEASYVRFLDLMTCHLERHAFLMGGRPGASDFAIYGQLTQLTHFDPTPMDLSLKRAPRVYAWVDVVDDLSGLQPTEADWLAARRCPTRSRHCSPNWVEATCR